MKHHCRNIIVLIAFGVYFQNESLTPIPGIQSLILFWHETFTESFSHQITGFIGIRILIWYVSFQFSETYRGIHLIGVVHSNGGQPWWFLMITYTVYVKTWYWTHFQSHLNVILHYSARNGLQKTVKIKKIQIFDFCEIKKKIKNQKNHFHSSFVGVKMIFLIFLTPVIHTPGVKVKNHPLYWITNKTLGQNVNKWYIMIFSLLLDWFSHGHRDSEWNTDSEWKYNDFT